MNDNILLIGEAILFSYFSFVIGEVILNWFHVPTAGLRRGAYALLAGYGAIGFGGMVLGAIGAFTAPVLWSAAVLVLILARGTIAAHARRVRAFRISSINSLFKNTFGGVRLLQILVILWIIVNFIIVFVPITGHDTLDYHLPVMQSLIARGALDLSATSRTALPVFGEVLYAVPIALFHETAAPFVFQLLQYIFFVLFAIIVYGFLKDRTAHAFLPWAGVLILFSLMDLWREVLHGGYVDVIAFVVGLVSMLIVVEHIAEKEAPPSAPLALSALFLGFGISIKYTGLIFAGFNGVALLVWFLSRKERRSRALKILVTYALLAGVVAGFWYAKNAVVFHNPIYPLASDEQATADIGFFMMDRTLPNLVKFPFYRYAQWFVQERETSSRLIVLGLLVVMYPLIIAALFLRRRLRASEFLLFLFVHFYFVILFYLSHQYRFLLPASMALAILLPLLLNTILNKVQQTRAQGYHLFERGVVTVCLLGFIVIFLGNLHYFEIKFRYIVGQYTREEYILKIGGQ